MSAWARRYVAGVVVERERAGVEPEDHPGVLGVEVDGLDARRPLHHLLLYLETQRHHVLSQYSIIQHHHTPSLVLPPPQPLPEAQLLHPHAEALRTHALELLLLQTREEVLQRGQQLAVQSLQVYVFRAQQLQLRRVALRQVPEELQDSAVAVRRFCGLGGWPCVASCYFGRTFAWPNLYLLDCWG